jgi:hypothetical protein
LALEVIRKYAGQNHKLVIPSRASMSRKTGRDASDSKVMKIKDNMVMVVSKGLNVGNDNPLLDILSNLLQQTRANRQKSKETKISVVAKEVGFQLLSQDFDVEVMQPVPGDQSDNQLDDVTSVEKESSDPMEDHDATNSEEKTVSKFDVPEDDKEAMHEKHGDSELEKKIEMEVEIKKMKEHKLSDMKQERIISNEKLEDTSEMEVDDNTGFVGSIFFSDGGYQLLNSLTSGSKVPTLIIIEPTKQQHFVLDKETRICYSSVVHFIDRFLNQSLPPFIRSDPLVSSMKEFPRPPFVNQDFHEAISVPKISANGFCESVVGYKDCLVNDKGIDPGNVTGAWRMDVLVLFSNSWCGFCQRVELVLREVFRALGSFMSVSKERDANLTENEGIVALNQNVWNQY